MITRDHDLFKDRVELSLDGKQVFYLFFGGAIIACMVFVLGVMVGKRLEVRTHAAVASDARDPLAAMDRLTPAGEGLSFRQSLGGKAAPATEVEREIAALEQQRTASQAAANAPAGHKAQAAAAVIAQPVVAKPVTPPAAPTPEAKPVVQPNAVTADKPVTSPDDVKAAKPAVPEDMKAKAALQASKWTLQLSAFEGKAQAAAFMADVKSAGYAAYLSEANVEGKGTVYRVRLGGYSDYDDAIAAKAEFERKLNRIAYVTRQAQ